MFEFVLFGRVWDRIGPKGDEALRMGWGGDGHTEGHTDGRTDGRTDSPCVLQDFGAAPQKERKKKKESGKRERERKEIKESKKERKKER